MFSWLIRLLLSLAGVVAAWFVATDAPNFGLVRTTIAIVLVVLFLGAAIFWQSVVDHFGSRHQRKGN